VFAVISAIWGLLGPPPVNLHFGWLAFAFFLLSLILGKA
jgi:hypothetical protein